MKNICVALIWVSVGYAGLMSTGALAAGQGEHLSAHGEDVQPSLVTDGPNSEAVAVAARTLSIKETGILDLIGSLGNTLYERGRASGTLSGAVEIKLTLVSSTHVTAVFTAKLSGGSINGQASGSFQSIGSLGYFGGTLGLTHGTGTYKHVSGRISISGILNRRNDHLIVHVSGKMFF